jgi:hypothetical protein
LIARLSLLRAGGLFSQDNLDDCEEALDFDFEQSFLFGGVDINDLLFGDTGDLVQSAHFALQHFSDPNGSLNDLVGGAQDYKGLLLVEEECKGATDVFPIAGRPL